ncbi:hypothetical protein BS47DRAFT_1368653 [Hydnum rufescens UP504]|uniref:Uncharacterized protein n=1 Tax=Hydnum rufescens UP504 TaxID=1448309 RepID=A0A9P6AEY1_9AGAM|nr:hypothetical protein BS47DRAFT_1368653 [Hydnum rufescens UP504]
MTCCQKCWTYQRKKIHTTRAEYGIACCTRKTGNPKIIRHVRHVGISHACHKLVTWLGHHKYDRDSIHCTFQSFIEDSVIGIRVLPGIDLQGHGTSAWSVIYQRISIRDGEAVTSQGLSSHVRNMALLPASSDKELVLERPSKSQAPLESSAGDGSCLLVMSNLPHPQPHTLWEMCQQGDVEYLNLCIYYLTWWFKSLGVRVDSVFATAFVGGWVSQGIGGGVGPGFCHIYEAAHWSVASLVPEWALIATCFSEMKTPGPCRMWNVCGTIIGGGWLA